MGTRFRPAVLARACTRLAAVLSVAAAIFGAFPVDAPAASGKPRRLPFLGPEIPGTKIACFDKKARRYFAKIEPWHCEFAGWLESAGYPGGRSDDNAAVGSFVRIPVKGEWERIEWSSGWGGGKAWSVEAVSVRSGDDLRLNAFRRVRCTDGSTWYSRIDIYNTHGGRTFLIRLPVCGIR